MRSFSLIACVVAAAACGGSKKNAKNPTELAGAAGGADLKIPNVDGSLCDAKERKVATFDLNQDGKADVWKLYRNLSSDKGTELERLSCKQVDLDHDGRKDYVVQYDEQGAMLVEDFDFDFDGRFDARHHYDKKNGQKYLIERVSGFAQRPDMWEKYDATEKLESVRRDRNADGKPDYWEQYTAGSLDKILYDDDYDGKVDRQDQKPVAEPPPGARPPVVPPTEPVTESKNKPATPAKTPTPAPKPTK